MPLSSQVIDQSFNFGFSVCTDYDSQAFFVIFEYEEKVVNVNVNFEKNIQSFKHPFFRHFDECKVFTAMLLYVILEYKCAFVQYSNNMTFHAVFMDHNNLMNC